jgi:hypothetical protein
MNKFNKQSIFFALLYIDEMQREVKRPHMRFSKLIIREESPRLGVGWDQQQHEEETSRNEPTTAGRLCEVPEPTAAA